MKPREYTEAGMSMPTNGLPGPTMAEGICWERSDSRSGYRRRRVLTTRQEVQTTWQETRDLLFSTTQATEKKKTTVPKEEFKNGMQDEHGEIKNREIRQEVRRA